MARQAAAEVSFDRRWEGAQREYRTRIERMAQGKYRSIPGFDADDMESQLWEVLWHAVVKYDPNNGANFQSFFNLLVSNRMRDLVRHAFAEMRQANLFCERLDVDEVRAVVESMNNAESAESEFLTGVTIHEWFASGRKEAKR